jgi:hypothetical protein
MNARIAGFLALMQACLFPELTAAQPINSERATSALRDAAEVCAPIALIQRQTRLVIANDTVKGQPYYRSGDQLFLTTAPEGTGFANTSFSWGGREWAMIMLPLPQDRFDRVSLVMHEVFHSKQLELGLQGADPPNNQLDQKDGRVWLRFELEALASALESLPSNKSAAMKQVNDALVFRTQRRALYPLADSLEPLLEMQEGLAEYTGEKLALMSTGEGPARVGKKVRDFQANPTYVRSFAYATGPALGVLLDEFAPGWKSELKQNHDPARILATHLHFTPPRQLAREAERRSKAYGADVILAEENARDAKRSAEMAAYKSHLVDGPVLTLTQKGISRMFDPTSMVGFDMTNTLYPTGTFGSDWGSIEVTSGGALIANDYTQIRVSAPTSPPTVEDRTVRGDGWVLTLSPGWAVYPSASKIGSFEVRKDK